MKGCVWDSIDLILPQPQLSQFGQVCELILMFKVKAISLHMYLLDIPIEGTIFYGDDFVVLHLQVSDSVQLGKRPLQNVCEAVSP